MKFQSKGGCKYIQPIKRVFKSQKLFINLIKISNFNIDNIKKYQWDNYTLGIYKVDNGFKV